MPMNVKPQVFRRIFDLNGRVALITGASTGFGEVIATGFAHYGCDVAVADVNLDGARRTAQKITDLGRRSIAIRADVGSPDETRTMVESAMKGLGTIDILVNSAGIS
jgi:NAD(P)-dependent dehydrogenase (short-subunit alcohol dehydrogenase family)